jgi:hypothetical protein
MNFSSKTDTLMKPFLNCFGKCDNKKLSKNDDNSVEKALISLYHDVYSANEIIMNDECLKYKISKKEEPSLDSNRYFPNHIQTYIKDNIQEQLTFSCKSVGSREINIHYNLFSKKDLINTESCVNDVRMMYIWLSICAKYSSKHCATSLDIYLYPTPFKKVLPATPSGVLGPDNVNTAFTYACAVKGQMIIYREEEWFKVFIHETFHAYGLDFSTSDITSLNDTLYTIFPINSDFDIYEAYTETWGRIINSVFCSFNSLNNKKDKRIFLSNLKFCLEMERMFSIYQCTKILDFMGLNYKDLYEKKPQTAYIRNKLYKENTHVFAYYIMTSIFLNDYKGFILWCKNHNNSLLQFNSSSDNFKAFSQYIESNHDCVSLLNNIDHMKTIQSRNKNNKELFDTTRMSIIHTI